MARSVEKSTSPFYTIRVMNIRKKYDKDGDGALSEKEVSVELVLSVDEIWTEEQIANGEVDLKGLEVFSSLGYLDCKNAHWHRWMSATMKN